MYKRYNQINILYSDKNKRYTSTVNMSNIPLRVDDLYVITKRGDRLDLLADDFYDDTTLWCIIARANHIGMGSMFIEPGTRLRIPNNPSTIQVKDVSENI